MNKKEKQSDKIKFENFNMLCFTMKTNGYQSVNAIYSNNKASFLGICCAIPFVSLISVLYWFFSHNNNAQDISINFFYKGLILITIFFISIPIHEILHGIGWCLAEKVKWRNIHITMEGGPLCHCDLPLKGTEYMIGTLLPVLVLGFIPSVISFFMSEWLLISFAVLSITVAGGDLLLALRVRKHLNDMIIDHPFEAGFVAFIK